MLNGYIQSLIILVSLLHIPSCSSPRLETFSAPSASTGGGNNGDPKAREKRLAAFAGKETFTYCLVTSSDVPMADTRLSELVEAEVNLWSAYITQLKLNIYLKREGALQLPIGARFKEDCNAVDLEMHFGLPDVASNLNSLLKMDRESLISGLFMAKSDRGLQQLAWIVGEKAAVRPISGLFPRETVDRLDYSKEKEISFVIRNVIGRLYGNVVTSGTVIGDQPENLLNRSEIVDSSLLDFDYLLVNGIKGGAVQIEGCLLDSEEAVLTLKGNDGSYELASKTLTLKSSWSNLSKELIKPTEVFAVDGVPRFFSDQIRFTGFASHDISPALTLAGMEKLSLNSNGVAASLILEQEAGTKVTQVFKSKAVCSESSITAAEKIKEISAKKE